MIDDMNRMTREILRRARFHRRDPDGSTTYLSRDIYARNSVSLGERAGNNPLANVMDQWFGLQMQLRGESDMKTYREIDPAIINNCRRYQWSVNSIPQDRSNSW